MAEWNARNPELDQQHWTFPRWQKRPPDIVFVDDKGAPVDRYNDLVAFDEVHSFAAEQTDLLTQIRAGLSHNGRLIAIHGMYYDEAKNQLLLAATRTDYATVCFMRTVNKNSTEPSKRALYDPEQALFQRSFYSCGVQVPVVSQDKQTLLMERARGVPFLAPAAGFIEATAENPLLRTLIPDSGRSEVLEELLTQAAPDETVWGEGAKGSRYWHGLTRALDSVGEQAQLHDFSVLPVRGDLHLASVGIRDIGLGPKLGHCEFITPLRLSATAAQVLEKHRMHNAPDASEHNERAFSLPVAAYRAEFDSAAAAYPFPRVPEGQRHPKDGLLGTPVWAVLSGQAMHAHGISVSSLAKPPAPPREPAAGLVGSGAGPASL